MDRTPSYTSAIIGVEPAENDTFVGAVYSSDGYTRTLQRLSQRRLSYGEAFCDAAAMANMDGFGQRGRSQS